MPKIDLEMAKLDPASVFKRPQDVLACKELTREQQIDILESWAYDEREKAVAEEENMPDLAMEEINILDEVLRCLIKLGVKHDEHSTDTKEG